MKIRCEMCAGHGAYRVGMRADLCPACKGAGCFEKEVDGETVIDEIAEEIVKGEIQQHGSGAIQAGVTIYKDGKQIFDYSEC